MCPISCRVCRTINIVIKSLDPDVSTRCSYTVGAFGVTSGRRRLYGTVGAFGVTIRKKTVWNCESTWGNIRKKKTVWNCGSIWGNIRKKKTMELSATELMPQGQSSILTLGIRKSVCPHPIDTTLHSLDNHSLQPGKMNVL